MVFQRKKYLALNKDCNKTWLQCKAGLINYVYGSSDNQFFSFDTMTRTKYYPFMDNLSFTFNNTVHLNKEATLSYVFATKFRLEHIDEL